MMCEPATITMVATALAAGTAAVGSYNQGQVAKKVGRNNQIMAEYAAQDAHARGEEQAIAAQRRAAQLRGRQRATMAGNGVDLAVGTPADLVNQTDFFGEVDANTARDNAARDAWSYRAQGTNARAQGNAAAQQGTMSAFGSVLGGVAQVSDQWMRYNPATPAAPANSAYWKS